MSKMTPDEFQSWRKARLERIRRLRAHARRIEAEIAAKKQSPAQG